MNFATRQMFAAFLVQLANNYKVGDVEKQFSVTPELEQRFQDKIVEKEDFLRKINVIGVEELSGKNVLAPPTVLRPDALTPRTATPNVSPATSSVLKSGHISSTRPIPMFTSSTRPSTHGPRKSPTSARCIPRMSNSRLPTTGS